MPTQLYKGFTIETKEQHITGIHENWVSQVIHPDSGILARFNKVVPALLIWEANQQDSIIRAKTWIDKQV